VLHNVFTDQGTVNQVEQLGGLHSQQQITETNPSDESIAEPFSDSKRLPSKNPMRDEMPTANSLAFLELRSLATSLSAQNQNLQQLAINANKQL
jgi:hypothetical protein